jgi:CPA2 family monovalent cation:H+ antiporter-2
MAESARHHSTESMMILSIAVAIGSAMVTEWLGFGAALGAFIAGFILATTTFRYQLRGQVIPLRNLFLAVFLTTLGMQMDPVSLLRWWWVILLGVAALTLVKAVANGLTCWAVGATGSVAVAVALALAQGGEFSLVILTIGREAGLLSSDAAGIAIAVVVLSLIITPGLIRTGYYFAQHPLWSRPAPWLRSTPLRDAIPADQPTPRPHVIIAGFGPVGRAIADRLDEAGMDLIMVELNPLTVQKQTRLGKQIIFGDVSNPEILEAANVRQASALVVTIPDPDAAVRTCAVARSMQPDLFIAVRTNIVSQAMLARAAGADHVTVEELATAESMQQAVITRILAQGGDVVSDAPAMAPTPASVGDEHGDKMAR